MNAADEWNDDRIHAYVDGELDAFTTARLEAACRQDAMLNARVEKQRRLRVQLKARFDPVLDEPIPARLLQTTNTPPSATVTPIRAARPQARIQPLWLGALAASLVIGLAIGWIIPRNTQLPVAAGGNGLVATGYLDKALSQALSSEGRTSSGVQVALSFQAGDGTFCRSFALTSGADGLACRGVNGWRIEVLGRAPARTEDYRQAGSPLSGAVLAAIGEKQSGDTLDVEQERQARNDGWRAAGKAPE
ncbi:MAG: hypothetical protein ABI645_13755 [Pseudomonadota bacterium]